LPGRVSGLGQCVVEIPERLRKIPELKTYGREVLIEIPHDNSFCKRKSSTAVAQSTDFLFIGIFTMALCVSAKRC
jgi:hypothetical protein